MPVYNAHMSVSCCALPFCHGECISWLREPRTPMAGSECLGLQELSEATEAYRQAKLAIGEREYLILCHTRSEEEILAKAAGVTAELQQASSCIDTLHDR